MPQGLVLGPVLFILYSWVLVSAVKHGKCHFYVDDMQILYFSGKNSIQEMKNTLVADLN